MSDSPYSIFLECLKYLAILVATGSGIYGLVYESQKKEKRTAKEKKEGRSLLYAFIVAAGIIAVFTQFLDEKASNAKEKAQIAKLDTLVRGDTAEIAKSLSIIHQDSILLRGQSKQLSDDSQSFILQHQQLDTSRAILTSANIAAWPFSNVTFNIGFEFEKRSTVANLNAYIGNLYDQLIDSTASRSAHSRQEYVLDPLKRLSYARQTLWGANEHYIQLKDSSGTATIESGQQDLNNIICYADFNGNSQFFPQGSLDAHIRTFFINSYICVALYQHFNPRDPGKDIPEWEVKIVEGNDYSDPNDKLPVIARYHYNSADYSSFSRTLDHINEKNYVINPSRRLNSTRQLPGLTLVIRIEHHKDGPAILDSREAFNELAQIYRVTNFDCTINNISINLKDDAFLRILNQHENIVYYYHLLTAGNKNGQSVLY